MCVSFIWGSSVFLRCLRFLRFPLGSRAASVVLRPIRQSELLAPPDPTKWCVWRSPRWGVWVPATLERRPSAAACWGPRPQARRQVALHLWDSPPPGAAGPGAPGTQPRGAASCRPASGGFPARWTAWTRPAPKTNLFKHWSVLGLGHMTSPDWPARWREPWWCWEDWRILLLCSTCPWCRSACTEWWPLGGSVDRNLHARKHAQRALLKYYQLLFGVAWNVASSSWGCTSERINISLIKKAHQHLFFLRVLRKAFLALCIQVQFIQMHASIYTV